MITLKYLFLSCTKIQGQSMIDTKEPKVIISKIEDLLNKELTLPNYQRPYKWKTYHVQQLLNDLLKHFEQNQTYRIGTVVLHQYDNRNDIVDGQQRLTTLTLLLYCLKLKEAEQKLQLLDQEYPHTISQKNLIQNYNFIKDFLKENTDIDKEGFKKYILSICEMVCVELNNLDEAFQFFDSQNARGKSLESYDLLKAYHLRAMRGKPEDRIYHCVSGWEQAALADEHTPNLHKIINQILFRLRAWQIGQSGEHFTSNKLTIFKGVSETSSYPYIQTTLAYQALAKFTSVNPFLFHSQFSQPNFQAKQTIIDGEYFFQYIEHYRKIYNQLFNKETGLLCEIREVNGIDLGTNLINFLDNHQGAYRTGDRYLRSLFECLVFAYFDKFGEERLNAFVNKAFIWVYRIRIEWQRITFATIDNAATERNSLLTYLEHSYTPENVMLFNNLTIQNIKFENIDKKIKEILGIENKE